MNHECRTELYINTLKSVIIFMLMKNKDLVSKSKISENRLYSRFLNIPVGKKLVLVYLIGIFLPLFISSFYFTARLMTEAKIQEKNSLNNSVDSLVGALEKEMEPLNIIAQSIIADTAIYRFVQQDYTDKREYYEVHHDYLKPTLDKYTAGFDLIGKIIIFVDNPTIGISSGYMTLNNVNRSSDWYIALQQDPDRNVVISYIENDPRIDYEEDDVLSLFIMSWRSNNSFLFNEACYSNNFFNDVNNQRITFFCFFCNNWSFFMHYLISNSF